MNGIFSIDGPVGRALSRFTDLLTLSVLWIVCSVPLVTLGASTTALYTMTLRIVRNEEGKISDGFLRAFKENFKNATIIHLILAAFTFLISFYVTVIGVLPEGMQTFFYGASLLFILLLLMEIQFVYPVQARFENTIWNVMKIAWLMAAGHLPVFLLTVLITGLPVWTLLLNTGLFIRMLPAWILVGPGLIAWLNSYLFQYCFKKYIPSDQEEL